VRFSGFLLDDLEDGVLRRYAMRNAVRLLWALLDAKESSTMSGPHWST
jgi:hypothetical protein